jgi:hypothetical protein
MLMQVEDMIAFNYTVFAEDEYGQFPGVMSKVRHRISEIQKAPKHRF